MLRQLCREGVLCIAATHDLNLAATYCQRLVVLHEGRVAIDAPPAEAFEAPAFARIFGPSVHAVRPATGRPWLSYGE
jgi:iron complex transport system ATP-binding protein